MSLINQMLRDLEHRRTGGSPDGSLLRQVRVTHRRLPRFWLAGVLLAIGSGFLLTFLLAPALRPSPAVKAAPEPILLQLAVMPAAAPLADEAPVERREEVLPAAEPISWRPAPPPVPTPPPVVAANPQSLAAAAAVATAPVDPAGDMTRVIRAPAPAEAAERELRAARSAWERGDLVQAEGRLRHALALA
ncbi:MAG: hypothetical protein IH614_07830, partial [Desulfuromonadales bacterium]|nr:hypothetical protein [Desulfuromonadales bacterium]